MRSTAPNVESGSSGIACLLLALLGVACSGGSSSMSDGGAGSGSGAGAAAPQAGRKADSSGWVTVGDFYPAFTRRAEAVTCPGRLPGSDECHIDADCGPGAACGCGGADGFGFINRCIPAECRSSADCGGRDCLLSLGSSPGECCTWGNEGLFCERDGSTCAADDYCPGNGIACMYTAERDIFECQLLTCSCL